MRSEVKNFFIKPLLVLAIAVPAMSTVSVDDAEARKRLGAFIAGVVVGGVIAHAVTKHRIKHRRARPRGHYHTVRHRHGRYRTHTHRYYHSH